MAKPLHGRAHLSRHGDHLVWAGCLRASGTQAGSSASEGGEDTLRLDQSVASRHASMLRPTFSTRLAFYVPKNGQGAATAEVRRVQLMATVQ